jgi:hypothetical protein
MTMISRMNSVVLLSGLAALISGCATTTDPMAPSLPQGQFVVIVKGEPGPLKTFHELVQKQMENKMLAGCERKVPASMGEGQAATGGNAPVGEQLVYECAAPNRLQGANLLGIFATAYGNSIASLLEMKITTSGACVARSCYGGLMRYWQQTPPCTRLC